MSHKSLQLWGGRFITQVINYREVIMDGLRDDRLDGAVAIAEFTGIALKRVFYLAEKRLIPVAKEGGRLIASKKTLRAHYEKLTGGATAV